MEGCLFAIEHMFDIRPIILYIFSDFAPGGGGDDDTRPP